MRVLPGQEGWEERINEFLKIKDFLIEVVNSNKIQEFQSENKIKEEFSKKLIIEQKVREINQC